jgi:tRNA pseudouridine13 synthase
MPLDQTAYPVHTVEDLSYAHAKPSGSGVFKQLPEDFIVEESLSFSLDDAGNQRYLYIEKENTNTEWLARQLARFAGITPRDVGYAGLKDRHAITRQWFSLKFEGVKEPDWQQLDLEGIKILKKVWHGKKLQRGAIASNRFVIRLRAVQNLSQAQLAERLQLIRETGVPNYFAQQRFGRDYNNLTRAAQWFQSAIKIKKRSDKSMLISAARSMVFNQLLSERIRVYGWKQLVPGEVMMLDGSRSIFSAPVIEQDVLARFKQHDIHPTSVLWGKGQLKSTEQLLQQETRVVETLVTWCQALEQQGLRQERRSIRVFPQQLTASLQTNDDASTDLVLSFSLPAGTYATSVLRELIQVEQHG